MRSLCRRTADRTEEIISTVGSALGPGVAEPVDANSGFSVLCALEVGRLLEAEGIDNFEEPCPGWKLEEIRQVADALNLDVTGGAQD